MTVLTTDQKIIRVGTADGHQTISQPQLNSTNLYAGTVAITRAGYLADPMAGVQSGDIVWGIINGIQDGAPHVTAPMAGGTTNGTHVLDIDTGTFFLAAGSGADALTQANVGQEVFLIDGLTVGATNAGGNRPTAGILTVIGAGVWSGWYGVRLGSIQLTANLINQPGDASP